MGYIDISWGTPYLIRNPSHVHPLASSYRMFYADTEGKITPRTGHGTRQHALRFGSLPCAARACTVYQAEEEYC